MPTLQNKIQVTGNVSPPTIEFAIAAYVPLHDTNRVLRDALINNTVLEFRYRVPGQTLATISGAGNTVGIAANTGVVTFAGQAKVDFTGEAYGPGISIKPAGGNTRYIVDTISDAGAVTVKPAPDAAVAPVVGYEIEVPPIYRPAFPARVMTFDNVEAGSESSLATSLGIAPQAILPRMTVGEPA